MRRVLRTLWDQAIIWSNWAGLVAMEQMSAWSMPALSMEARSPLMVPSLKELPAFWARAPMARGASVSGKAWV